MWNLAILSKGLFLGIGIIPYSAYEVYSSDKQNPFQICLLKETDRIKMKMQFSQK